MTRYLALGALAAALSANAADIQKCADAAGRITYQDSPCPRGSTIGTVARDRARADPAALRELARQRQRLERAVDAQLAAPQSASPSPVIVALPGTGAAGDTAYSYATAYPYGAIAGATPAANGTAPQPSESPNASPTSVPAAGMAMTQPPAGVPATIAQPSVGDVTGVPELPAITPVPGAAPATPAATRAAVGR